MCKNDTEISKRRTRLIVRTTAVAAAITLVVVLLHNFWMPMDVLFYKALHRADLVINT